MVENLKNISHNKQFLLCHFMDMLTDAFEEKVQKIEREAIC